MEKLVEILCQQSLCFGAALEVLNSNHRDHELGSLNPNQQLYWAKHFANTAGNHADRADAARELLLKRLAECEKQKNNTVK